MPALNTSNIRDAKLGSTFLSAVYKGSTPIWIEPPKDPLPIAYNILNLAVSDGPVLGEDGKNVRRAFFWVPGDMVDVRPQVHPCTYQYINDAGQAGRLPCWPTDLDPDQVRYNGWTYTRVSVEAARGNAFNTFLIKIAARAEDWPEYPDFTDFQIILEDGTPDPFNPIVTTDKLPNSVPQGA